MRLSANTLTSVTRVSRYVRKNEPRIAPTPTTSGMAEATSAPKTKARRMKVKGIAIPSAKRRSVLILELMASVTTAPPPA